MSKARHVVINLKCEKATSPPCAFASAHHLWLHDDESDPEGRLNESINNNIGYAEIHTQRTSHPVSVQMSMAPWKEYKEPK